MLSTYHRDIDIYRNGLFPTDGGNSVIIGITVGSVLGVCIVVVIIILLVLFVRQHKIMKYATRYDSYNDYTEPPSMLRLFILSFSILYNST